jgi:hypothetical protein
MRAGATPPTACTMQLQHCHLLRWTPAEQLLLLLLHH